MENVLAHSLLSDFDIDLFRAGKHFRLFEKMGSHPMELNGVQGTYFAVYAPAARQVSVIGDFNHWQGGAHKLFVRWDGSGIWEGFIPGIGHGIAYKYHILSDHGKGVFEKGDPFAKYWEQPPRTASIIWDRSYDWQDAAWMKERSKHNALNAPYSVYEVHAQSWMFNTAEGRHMNWLELAEKLPAYVKEMGFTHVEFMPIMEYPYAPSWGYQLTGYFAPSSRFGEPEGFATLVDALHKEGIGVILDWVPSHFPSDEHGLGLFDGSCVYEHPDPSKGYHPDWKSLIFNYGRPEVRSFLISNALYWLERYHADGLRVDAVASMLYLDYSRKDGEWQPNEFGGRENLDAISFLKDLNTAIYQYFPDVQSIAEESTSFPGVTRPVDAGGLGFGMKWMMGWMNDNLRYFEKDPIYRKHHHNELSFSLAYAFTENFMLPLSHDEVVYGKKSLLRKMPGDDWQQFANLRLLLSWMYTHPGTKLLFMGGEFGQSEEWSFEQSLDWHLLQYKPHQGVQKMMQDLNKVYTSMPPLYEDAFTPAGFEWIDHQDAENSVICFLRKSPSTGEVLLCVANATPTSISGYRVGIPSNNDWVEIFNSDDEKYGGSGHTNEGILKANLSGWHGKKHSIDLRIPPLGLTILQPKTR